MDDELSAENVPVDAAGLDLNDVAVPTEQNAENDLAEEPNPHESGEPEDEAENDLLSTDRLGTDVLESLFTERTETDQHEAQDETELPDESPCQEHAIEADADAGTVLELPTDPETELVPPTQLVSRATSPLGTVPVDQSPFRPAVPARPPRPTPLASPPPSLPSLQLVSFDVGGRLFRCKASLVLKFPTKRLARVISCGCEQLASETFFIDRNPQHFELVLDWYRTGKCSRPFPPHVNELALKEDAKYFDLYEEFFPVVPVRQDTLPRLPDRPSRQPTPLVASVAIPTKCKPSPDVFRFCKREFRSVAPTAPVWFSMRANEHLVVESVRGNGKLFVRVTDASGMERVLVDQAVLFDSRSWFYLDADGRAKLQHCVLPGNHVYALWMEPIASEQQASPPPPPAKQKTSKGKMATAPPTTVAAKPELEVEFRLVSTFSPSDQVEDDKELDAVLEAKGKGWGDSSGSSNSGIASNDARQCLFLPPRSEDSHPRQATEKTEEPNDYGQRDAIAEQIRTQAAKERASKVVVVEDLPSSKAMRNALKRSGAAIVTQQQKPRGIKDSSMDHGGEKVTVYQPIPPAALSPRSPAKPQPTSATYSMQQQPRQFRQR